jgi:hypothetical protein
MKYYRIHEEEIAWATGKPRGIFVAVWKLLERGLFTKEEETAYYENKRHFEAILPVPPFYESGNTEKAITWYKNNSDGNDISGRMTFYFEMAKKYGLELFKTSATDIPGEVIYEDDFQIAVINSKHDGEGFVVEPFTS